MSKMQEVEQRIAAGLNQFSQAAALYRQALEKDANAGEARAAYQASRSELLRLLDSIKPVTCGSIIIEAAPAVGPIRGFIQQTHQKIERLTGSVEEQYAIA